jgi:hypothetical protein
LHGEPLEARLALTAGLPLAVNDLIATSVDQPLVLGGPGVLANDVAAASAGLSAHLFSGPQHGTLELSADGGLTYVPDPGYRGLDSFLYFAKDGTQQSLLAAVTIRVDEPPLAPQAVDDVYSLPEDGTLDLGATHGVLANDQFLGRGAVAELIQGPANGTLTLAANGGLVYQPAADFSGIDTFVYEAVTSEGQRTAATVTLHVTPVNDSPQAANDAFTTPAGHPLVVGAQQGLLANDRDSDGDALVVEWVALPEHGTLVWQPDGSLSYTPQPGFTGPDGFRYRLSDGTDVSNTAAVTIVVTPQNTAPLAVNDEWTTDEDHPLVLSAPGVLTNDQDADGDALSATLVNPPRFGTLTLAADGSLMYTPAPDFFGVDGFSYLASDGQDTSAAAGVTIVVQPVADAPRPGQDRYQTLAGQALVVDAAAGVLANDIDPDGETLALSLAQPPAHGTLSLAEDGSFVYTPEAGFVGRDQFVYQVSDGVQAASATVEIDVTSPENRRPEAVNDQFTLLAGSVLTIAPEGGLLRNDVDPEGQPLAASLFAPPLNGTLSLTADGAFEYTPAPGFSGVDAFLYRVSDGVLDSALAAVTLYVLPAPQTPQPGTSELGSSSGGTPSGEELAAATILSVPSPLEEALQEAACHGPHSSGTSSVTAENSIATSAADEDSGQAFAAAVDALWSAGLSAV